MYIFNSVLEFINVKNTLPDTNYQLELTFELSKVDSSVPKRRDKVEHCLEGVDAEVDADNLKRCSRYLLFQLGRRKTGCLRMGQFD
jgi:hypothetical protein